MCSTPTNAWHLLSFQWYFFYVIRTFWPAHHHVVNLIYNFTPFNSILALGNTLESFWANFFDSSNLYSACIQSSTNRVSNGCMKVTTSSIVCGTHILAVDNAMSSCLCAFEFIILTNKCFLSYNLYVNEELHGWGEGRREKERDEASKQAQAWNKNYEWSLKMLLFLFNLTLEQIFRIQVGLDCDYNHSQWNSEREMTSDIPYTINIYICTYGVRHEIAVRVCICVCVLGNPYEWPKRKREETIKATITTATKESNTPYRNAHTQSHIHTYATVLSCTANVLWTFNLITYRIDTHDTNRHVAQEEEHTYPVC